MAARKTRGTKEHPWSEEHRNRIKTSMLLNRLEKHILGEVDMSNTQIKAVDILLKKSVPDLQSISLSGEGGGGINVLHRLERVIVDPKKD